MANPPLVIQPEIAEALANGDTVVGLESTLIAHGLPWPTNWETAQSAEQAIRDEGGMPATIGIWHGQPIIGMEASQIEFFARTPDVMRATRRDLASVMMQSQHAATTVAATIVLANQAGIQVVATGGLGGAHRATTWEESTFWDVSADLWELARVPVLVVCSGIKSILDIARTLEILESYSVPVAAYGTDQFPAFYLRG
ncbi:MAG: hypothetical protein KatS3mg105_0107 [Gemmatales bacterium]|nr:MAG: hypothetical protein KatS3mg105_0107 [Gemmatales bacterium]